MYMGQGQNSGCELTSMAVSAAVTRPTNAVTGHVITVAVLRARADLLTSVAIVTSFTRCNASQHRQTIADSTLSFQKA